MMVMVVIVPKWLKCKSTLKGTQEVLRAWYTGES